MGDRIAIALLAAGAAKRFGGGKLDHVILGKRVGDWALHRAHETGLPIAIIVPVDIPLFAREAAEHGQAVLVQAPDAAMGIAHSLSAAAHWAIAQQSGLIVAAADMPLIQPKTLNQIALAVREGVPAAALYPDHTMGIPAGFPNARLASLLSLTGDSGAAKLLGQWGDTRRITLHPSECLDFDHRTDEAMISDALHT